jgi:nitrite reductase/ring-hydroxylating ferredoxin subunit
METTRIPMSEVPETGTKLVTVKGHRVLLCRSGGSIRAIGEVCPHQVLSLEGAKVRGNSIFCPHHGARFSLEDGRSLCSITDRGLTLYDAEIVGGELVIFI